MASLDPSVSGGFRHVFAEEPKPDSTQLFGSYEENTLDFYAVLNVEKDVRAHFGAMPRRHVALIVVCLFAFSFWQATDEEIKASYKRMSRYVRVAWVLLVSAQLGAATIALACGREALTRRVADVAICIPTSRTRVIHLSW